MKMKKCYKFKLKGVSNRGTLIPLEKEINVPFEVKRIFYILGMDVQDSRGNHAYHKTRQVLIAMSGELEVRCFDGKKEYLFKLDNPEEALYISPNVWRTTFNHSKNAVLLILSSEVYSEEDYIRSYNKFMMCAVRQYKRAV